MVAARQAVLALDLEGTLISNAMSCFPRPGLCGFLELCADRFERVVLFTAVDGVRTRAIAELLASEGAAPDWFGRCEIVTWSGPHKDLKFINGAEPDRSLLVDDLEAYVLPEQRDRWVAIAPFEPPYPETDNELARVATVLVARVQGVRTEPGD